MKENARGKCAKSFSRRARAGKDFKDQARKFTRKKCRRLVFTKSTCKKSVQRTNTKNLKIYAGEAQKIIFAKSTRGKSFQRTRTKNLRGRSTKNFCQRHMIYIFQIVRTKKFTPERRTEIVFAKNTRGKRLRTPSTKSLRGRRAKSFVFKEHAREKF